VLRSRVIPCLLVQNGGLVKTTRFKDPKYVGDPINAVRIFNEKEVDELIVVDIDATAKKREPDYRLIENLAAECRMPLCYGGGVKTAEQAQRIIGLGVEKVAMSSALIEQPSLAGEISEAIGSQSVVLVVDVRKSLLGKYSVCVNNGRQNTRREPFEVAAAAAQFGIGEIVVNSIDNDGRMTGYDVHLAEKMREAVDVPMTVLGGAGNIQDIRGLIDRFKVVGAAAGSLFVFKGKYRAVLISYPNVADRIPGAASRVA
jgi:cyclase